MKRVDSWFPEDAQTQVRQQAQLEADTSLLAALHATGDIKTAAPLAAGVTDSASNIARKTAASVPDACITAARAQAMALGLATARQVGFLLAKWTLKHASRKAASCQHLPSSLTELSSDTFHLQCMQLSVDAAPSPAVSVPQTKPISSIGIFAGCTWYCLSATPLMPAAGFLTSSATATSCHEVFA